VDVSNSFTVGASGSKPFADFYLHSDFTDACAFLSCLKQEGHKGRKTENGIQRSNEVKINIYIFLLSSLFSVFRFSRSVGT